MPGFFIYSTKEGTKDVLKIAKNRGYTLCPLNSKPDKFWGYITGAADARVPVIILSHGDPNGPLMVGGTEGADMTNVEIVRLGNTLASCGSDLFVLSCHTGGGAFWDTLCTTPVSAVAPRGTCFFGNACDETLIVKSLDPDVVCVTTNPPRSMGRGSRGGVIKLP